MILIYIENILLKKIYYILGYLPILKLIIKVIILIQVTEQLLFINESLYLMVNI